MFSEVYSEGNVTNEYKYDKNGNMISDANKAISSVSYNYLNLPERVSTSEGTVHYTYDATGTKLKKFYDKTSGTDEITEYLGGIQYKDGVLDFIQHSEGRARKNGSSFAYEYNLTDHLGNVRVTVDAAGAVVQRDDYYPFGLTFNSFISGTENLYKYNGKEEQKGTGWYDYGARMYDAALGRWHNIDPLADDFTGISPYNYVANNPIILVDPDGRAWKPTYIDGVASGYEWIDESESYGDDGNLLEGLYHQAIFLTENYNFDPESDYNIGSSTLIVYTAAGGKEEYNASTKPSDLEDYPTVPEGVYEAQVGTHYGTNPYTALRTGDVGTVDFGPGNNTIELGFINPAFDDGRTHATGINIHKAGLNNRTGMTNSGDPISAGCVLCDRNTWNSLIGHFDNDVQRGNTVSVTISRTYSTPLNFNFNTRDTTVPNDNTRVQTTIKR